jgi:hypothetical protein
MTAATMRKTFTAFVFILACHASGNAAEIRLRPDAKTAGSIVRLVDVAEIVPGDDGGADPEIGNLMLFPTPAAGQPLLVSRLEIEQVLRLSGVDFKRHWLGGAEAVEVRAANVSAGKTIVRPALHLIPAARFVRPASAEVAAFQKVAAEAVPLKPVPPPELVKRNSSVTVHATAAGVRISTSGKALSGGVHGAVVSVELDGHERVQAKVIGPQMVQVGN